MAGGWKLENIIIAVGEVRTDKQAYFIVGAINLEMEESQHPHLKYLQMRSEL